MFEALIARAEDLAGRRARARAAAFAGALRETLPGDIEVAASEEGVRVSGRALARRFALDAGLRWVMTGLIK